MSVRRLVELSFHPAAAVKLRNGDYCTGQGEGRCFVV